MISFHSYKNRIILDGQRVKVYYNLHNGKYSAVALDGCEKGRVLGHFDNVTLRDVSFSVSEAGRQRVIREKRKNVHAYAIGSVFLSDQTISLDNASVLRYNPYKMSQFHANNIPVTGAKLASLGPTGFYAKEAK